MMRCQFIFVLLFFIFSCKQKPRVPDNILPPQKMENVMTDMMRADELINQEIVADSLRLSNKKRINLYQKVLKIHKTNKQQFQASLKFYQNHPDLLKIVIDSMHSKTSRFNNPVFDSTNIVIPKKKA